MHENSKLKQPFLLQGQSKQANYFEGWYFKQVNLALNRTISFIFGISTHHSDPHAFIQVIHSHPLKTYYIRYPLDSFFAKDDGYQLGDSYFSQKELKINIQTETLSCKAQLSYATLTPLKSTLYQPNIMGPFAYLGKMECNHGVVSMHHVVNGTLTLNGEAWLFNQDVGYIEKDWGKSFPKRYIWLQGNHFKNEHTHLMVSVADIPFGLFHFEGLIAQLNHPQYAKRMATYTLAHKSKLIKTTDGFTLTLKQGSTRLILDVQVNEKAELVSPHEGKMKNTIKEGLGGQITIKLYEKESLLYEDTSLNCGIEIEGY